MESLDSSPLQGMIAALGGGTGVGDLPWDLHEVSFEREQLLLGGNDPPPAVWFNMAVLGDEELHRRSIALLGLIHLLGRNVARVTEVWVYRREASSLDFEQVRQLRMPLRGKAEFFLPAGTSEESLLTSYSKITRALERAPWLRITLEHFLLAIDRTGLSNGVLDLTIGLESLIRANTEVSFRFSHQIPRLVTGAPSEFEEYQTLLSALYSVRSSHVHGDDPGPSNRRIVEARMGDLLRILRQSVVYAIEFHGSDLTREESWNQHFTRLLHGTAVRLTPDWGIDDD